MIAVNYSNARYNFKQYCDAAVNDLETVFITRKQGENVVMISEAEYNNLMENLFVRRSKADYRRLLKSIEQAKAGRLTAHELLEDESE